MGRDEFPARTPSRYWMFATARALVRATAIDHDCVEYARDRACVQLEQQSLRILKHCRVIGRNLESRYEQEPVCCPSPFGAPFPATMSSPAERLTFYADAIRLL